MFHCHKLSAKHRGLNYWLFLSQPVNHCMVEEDDEAIQCIKSDCHQCSGC